MLLRILVISDVYPPVAYGGYERQCAALVNALRERHDVTVLTSDLRRNEVEPHPDVRRELPHTHGGKREVVRAPSLAVRAATVARDVIAAVDPEIVYVSNSVVIPQAAVCVALNRGLPLVYRLSEWWFAQSLHTGDRFLRHLLPGDRRLRRAFAPVFRLWNHLPALRLDPAQHVRIAVSWCSNDLRGRVALPQMFEPVLERTIYPGSANGRAFAALDRRPSPRVTIAYVGRLTTAKGVEVAYRALARLRRDSGIDARLVLAGPSEPATRRNLDRLAEELGISGEVELLGPLDTPALGRLLGQAHAIVIPSVEPEAFGNVCIEAGLARVPIVASRVGGIPEALRDGRDALLFAPGDDAACAAALAETVADAAATGVRVRCAFARMREFSLERYVTASEQFIIEARAVLAASGERPRSSLTPTRPE